jgi:hypothetical protein
MAVINRFTLVLCGSTIQMDGKAGNARRGSDYAASLETPEIGISMRHPSLNWGQEFQPALRSRHADDLRVDRVVAFGAGRSRSCAGVLSRRGSLRRFPDGAATFSAGVTPAARTVVTRRLGGLAWCKPANRTLSASTGGHGIR